MTQTKNLLFNLSIGASLLTGQVALAEENFGWYATGSIGGSQISDIRGESVTGPAFTHEQAQETIKVEASSE